MASLIKLEWYVKPIMIALSAGLHFDDFVRGSFKAETIEKEGSALVFTTTLVGKATKAPDYKKNQLIRNFLIKLGEWTQAHLDELHSQGIKEIRVSPIVEDLMGRLRRTSGSSRFYLNSKETSFHIVVGKNYLLLSVPEKKVSTIDNKAQLANLRNILKGNT